MAFLSSLRPYLIWSVRLIGAALVLLALLVLGARWWITTESGRRFIETRIENLAPEGQQIEMSGLQGDPLGRFQIDRLSIEDETGIWFDGEDLDLEWSLWPLLRRELEIDRVSATHIRFRRPDLLARSAPSSGGNFPLKAVRLGTLALPHLEYIGGGFEAAPIFALEASGHYEDNGFAAKLDLSPIESTADSLILDVTKASGNPLFGMAQIRGEAGGWMGDMLGLAASESLAADLEASGSPENWTLESTLDISGIRMLSLNADTRGTQTQLEGRFQKTLPWIPEAIKDRLGSETDFAATFDKTGEERFALEAVSNSEAFTLKANGTGARMGDGIAFESLNVNLNVPERSALLAGTDIRVQSANYTGTLNYHTTEDISLDGRIDVQSLKHDAIAVGEVSGPIKLALTGSDLALSTRLATQNLRRPDQSALPLLGTRPKLALTANLDIATNALSLRSLKLDGSDITLNAQQRGRRLVGDVAAKLADFGLGSNANFAGTYNLTLPKEGNTRLTLEGVLGKLTLPESLAGLSETLPIRLDITRAQSGLIRVNRLDARNGDLVLTASGQRATQGEMSLDAVLTAPQLSIAEGSQIEGLTATATLAGTQESYSFTSQVSADQASYGSTIVSDFETILQGTGSGENVSTNLNLTTLTEYGLLKLEAAPSLTRSNWNTGAILATLDAFSADGEFAGPLNDPINATGALHISGVPENTPLEALDLKLSLDNRDAALSGSARAKAAAGFDASDIQLTAQGTQEDFRADISIETAQNLGTKSNPIQLQAALTGGLSAQSLTMNLNGNYGAYPIETIAPLTFDWANDTPMLTGQLQAFDGQILLDAEDTQAGLSGKLALKTVSLARLSEAFALKPVSGLIDTDLAFNIGEAEKSLQIDGAITNLAADVSDLDPVNASFVANVDKNDLQAKVNLSGDGADLLLTLAGTSDWSSGAPRADRDRPLDFTAKGAGAIDAFSALILPAEMSLTGALDADLSGQITTSGPIGGGTLLLADGRFEHGDLGLTLTDLTLQSRLNDDMLSLISLSARNGSDGTLTGAGRLSLTGQGTDEIRLQLDELTVLDRSHAEAKASGALQLARTDNRTSINGALTIGRADIRLDRIVQSAKPTLPVRFTDDAPVPKAPPTSTRLDIRIDAPRRIFAEGRGLDAELSATARIRGTATAPLITAEANIIRGKFSFAGQAFDLVDSRVTLVPGSDEANLNIRAERRAADLTAIISITGTQTRPVITMSSDPSLPESEILSRLLFGLSPGQLTPIQSARLAATLAGLAGGSGFDVLGRLENVLLLDTLDFAESSDGTAIITTGKYIRPNVYVEAQNSLDGDVGVAIDWEPFSNLTVRGETSSDTGQELSVRWRRDFDRIKKQGPDNGD